MTTFHSCPECRQRTPGGARSFGLIVLAVWAVPGILVAQERGGDAEFFEKKIRPLLADHCYECHGPDEAAAKLR